MSYIPIPEPTSIPLPITTGDTVEYILDDVPADATEVLLYFFVSVRDSSLPEVTRSYYEYKTKEGDIEYTKYMNIIFTKGDYVMNSENIWFPVVVEAGASHPKITIHLNEGYPWPPSGAKKAPRRHKNLKEAMADYNKCKANEDAIFAEFFATGYRTALSKK